MSDTPPNAMGSIGWADLTVPDAAPIRDFYAAVAGWIPQPTSQGEYDDYTMLTPDTRTPTSGICHARGSNANIPPQWLVYITVADLDASLAACRARGGKVVAGPGGSPGHARFAVIRDPAGAVAALCQGA